MPLPPSPFDAPFVRIAALRERTDEEATRALVEALRSAPPSVRLEAARALHPRRLPDDVRRAVGDLIDETAEHEPPGVGAQLLRWMYACAAKAVLDDAPSAAYERLKPLLRRTALSRTTERLRAVKILEALEEYLAAHWLAQGSGEAVPLPDERFLAACDALCAPPVDGAVRIAASLARDGFRFLSGQTGVFATRRVELGAFDDAPFPFIVAGFELEDHELPGRLGEASVGLKGLLVFDHQFGGHACHKATFVGFGVSLPRTAPALDVLRRSYTDTSGEAFTAETLKQWRVTLGGAGAFPPLHRGEEALLLSEPCEPARFLRGCHVLEFGTMTPPWRPVIEMDADAHVSAGAAYTESHDLELRRIGETLGLGVPRLAYLWGNSD